MDIISLSALIGFILLSITSFLPHKKTLIRKYSRMEQRDLIHANISAKKFTKLGLGLAFVAIPIVVSLLMSIITDNSIRKIIVALTILAILNSIAVGGTFWKIAGLTEMELKIRENKSQT